MVFLVTVSGPVAGLLKKNAIQEGPGRFWERFREADHMVKGQVKEYLTAVIYIYSVYIYI